MHISDLPQKTTHDDPVLLCTELQCTALVIARTCFSLVQSSQTFTRTHTFTHNTYIHIQTHLQTYTPLHERTDRHSHTSSPIKKYLIPSTYLQVLSHTAIYAIYIGTSRFLFVVSYCYICHIYWYQCFLTRLYILYIGTSRSLCVQQHRGLVRSIAVQLVAYRFAYPTAELKYLLPPKKGKKKLMPAT